MTKHKPQSPPAVGLPAGRAGRPMLIGRTGSGKTTVSDLYATLRLSDAEFRLVWGDGPGSAPDLDPPAEDEA
ncbi:hypothetical protein [Burkholderia alba]|uniref:hypothetical protein n=1 Tax=Burkholderia alba TaxID=2683677 RepID=UPI002B05A2BE|nr:hypothetical protein [Burkholderia alba]